MSLRARLKKLETRTHQGELTIVVTANDTETAALIGRYIGRNVLVVQSGVERAPDGPARRRPASQ